MPIWRYLMFTSTALLSLLFGADNYLEKSLPFREIREIDKSVIRVHSKNNGPGAVFIVASSPR